MLKVFPCFSTHDRQTARELAAFLERGSGVEVLLEEGEMQPGEDLIAKTAEALSADVALVLMSPDSAPAKWLLERWRPVFQDQAAEFQTPVATLLCRDAKFPDLLRRKNFFDLRQDRLAAFRAVKRWLMSLTPLARQSPFVPAEQPLFSGRETELESLAVSLADTPGTAVVEAPAGGGKTALAIEFARRHREEFDAVFWLTCGGRSAVWLAGELAAQLDAHLDRDLESNLNELRRLCARHRCLLVLDDADMPAAAALTPRGRTSTLVTSRQSGFSEALSAVDIPLAPFGPDSAAIAGAVRDLNSPARRLLSAMCACSPCGFPLDMAARTADAERDEAREMAGHFASQSLVLPLDQSTARFLIPAAVRERVALRGDGARWARYHALAVSALFDFQAGAQDLAAYWPDLECAFAGALEADWPLASALARRCLTWAKAQDRLAEAFEILQSWHAAAQRHGDRRALEDCAWEQIWILEHWGRTGEASQLEQRRRTEYADQLSFSFDQS